MGARRHFAGFTLVELVITIVLLAFGTLAISQFLGRIARAYVDVSARESTVQVSRLAMERVSRELRQALPGSIRVASSADQDCIEFMPIAGSGSYLDLPVSAPATSFQAADFAFSPVPGLNYYVAVYTLDPAEVYAGTTPHRVGLAGVDAVDGTNERRVNLAGAFQFAAESPAHRFFIVGEPVSFCVAAGALWRHADYGVTATQAVPPGNPVLLAERIQRQDGATVVIPFAYAPATVRRAGLVRLDFRFLVSASEDEWVRVDHEVFVRNTP